MRNYDKAYGIDEYFLETSVLSDGVGSESSFSHEHPNSPSLSARSGEREILEMLNSWKPAAGRRTKVKRNLFSKQEIKVMLDQFMVDPFPSDIDIKAMCKHIGGTDKEKRIRKWFDNYRFRNAELTKQVMERRRQTLLRLEKENAELSRAIKNNAVDCIIVLEEIEAFLKGLEGSPEVESMLLYTREEIEGEKTLFDKVKSRESKDDDIDSMLLEAGIDFFEQRKQMTNSFYRDKAINTAKRQRKKLSKNAKRRD